MAILYFVHVTYNDGHGVVQSSGQIERDAPITCLEDVTDLAQKFKEAAGIDVPVLVTNWRRFEQPE